MSLDTNHTYDVAIVGGGLAGLSISIQLARAGYRVAIFEKEAYPFHKVCGEYLSFENWNFLEELGLPLSDWHLPFIKQLQVSSPRGNHIENDLGLGGFGISRYKLDAALADLAKKAGVQVFEQTKVLDIQYKNQCFHIQCAAFNCTAKVACGSFGKRSNLDIKWKRGFAMKKNGGLNNFIAVKYHIKTDFPSNLIALHNFKDGYCGISQIEEEKCCLCYLTTAKNLRDNHQSIPEMEKNVLQKNPFLKKIFSSSQFLYEQPITISQISFEKKLKVENHILMIGDAAGMIMPLCGNGMSMALHGGKIAFKNIDAFLKNQIARYEMEQDYTDEWDRVFGKRLLAGRSIQCFFGNEKLSEYLVRFIKPYPKFVTYLIRQTHGSPY